MNYDKELAFAKELAAEAGGVMRRYFRADDIGTEWKEDRTPLTVADTAINKLVIDRVKAHDSSHGILGEEDSFNLDADYLWVVDPIDGTVMYSAGLPIATFSLALVDHKGDGQPIVAVIYDPFSDRLWSAIKDTGAWLNDNKIHVNDTSELSPKSLVDLSSIMFRPEKNAMDPKEIIRKLSEHKTRVTVHQSVAIIGGLVASGDYTASIMNIKTAWDAAAAALIVQEAGGVVTDIEGKQQRYDVPANGTILANPVMHKKIIEVINS